MMKGQCLCGDTTFSIEVLATPFKIYQCHCSLCKKQSGSSSNSATIIEASQFKWIKRDHIKTWQKPTGFSSHFCGNCGCPVPNAFAGKYYWIPVGLLDIEDNLIQVEVVANFCLRSKSSWHHINATANNFDELPEFERLLAFLS